MIKERKCTVQRLEAVTEQNQVHCVHSKVKEFVMKERGCDKAPHLELFDNELRTESQLESELSVKDNKLEDINRYHKNDHKPHSEVQRTEDSSDSLHLAAHHSKPQRSPTIEFQRAGPETQAQEATSYRKATHETKTRCTERQQRQTDPKRV